MSRAIIPTPYFHLPTPGPESVEWVQTLRDFLDQCELKIGTNCNLIVPAQSQGGMAAQYTLAFIAGQNQLKIAQSQASLWGRLVCQDAMVANHPTLGRLIGITDVAGLSLQTAFGETLYHRNTGNGLTTDPNQAVRVISSRSTFLPLGFAFEDGHSCFFNGALPLQYMPIVISGLGVAYKPGIQDPIGTLVEGWSVTDNMARWLMTFDVPATVETIDLLVPFAIPSDWLLWLSRGDVWAFRFRFKTTATSTVSVLSIIDSANVELNINGTAQTSVGAFTTVEVSQATIHALGGTWVPGTNVYLRLRLRGAQLSTVLIESRSLMQYFPRVSWT